MGRIEKINQLMKEEISKIIQFEVKDPRLKFVTIIQVEVSRDLQHARVYFSVLGNREKVRLTQEGLNRAKGFIRRLIGQYIRMRYTPEIEFIFDRSLEYSMAIEEVLERIKDEGKPHRKSPRNHQTP